MKIILLEESRIEHWNSWKYFKCSSAVLDWTVKSETFQVKKLITVTFHKSKSLGTNLAFKERIIIEKR